jgi:hypothetical protein
VDVSLRQLTYSIAFCLPDGIRTKIVQAKGKIMSSRSQGCSVPILEKNQE